MIVWIVRRVWAYDGSVIEKVFLSEPDAKQYCNDELAKYGPNMDGDLVYNSYDVVK